MIRVEISNPPAFGARIVAAILEDEELYAQWRKDLVTMSSRIAEMRWELYQGLTELGTHFSPLDHLQDFDGEYF